MPDEVPRGQLVVAAPRSRSDGAEARRWFGNLWNRASARESTRGSVHGATSDTEDFPVLTGSVCLRLIMLVMLVLFPLIHEVVITLPRVHHLNSTRRWIYVPRHLNKDLLAVDLLLRVTDYWPLVILTRAHYDAQRHTCPAITLDSFFEKFSKTSLNALENSPATSLLPLQTKTYLVRLSREELGVCARSLIDSSITTPERTTALWGPNSSNDIWVIWNANGLHSDVQRQRFDALARSIQPPMSQPLLIAEDSFSTDPNKYFIMISLVFVHLRWFCVLLRFVYDFINIGFASQSVRPDIAHECHWMICFYLWSLAGTVGVHLTDDAACSHWFLSQRISSLVYTWQVVIWVVMLGNLALGCAGIGHLRTQNTIDPHPLWGCKFATAFFLVADHVAYCLALLSALALLLFGSHQPWISGVWISILGIYLNMILRFSILVRRIDAVHIRPSGNTISLVDAVGERQKYRLAGENYFVLCQNDTAAETSIAALRIRCPICLDKHVALPGNVPAFSSPVALLLGCCHGGMCEPCILSSMQYDATQKRRTPRCPICRQRITGVCRILELSLGSVGVWAAPMLAVVRSRRRVPSDCGRM